MQTRLFSSNLAAIQGRDSRRRWAGLIAALYGLVPFAWVSSPYRWYAVLRNLRARIRIQFSTTEKPVDLGPAFLLSGGRYLANARTRARAEGIRKLLAIHPWADTLDFRTFLMGFEAGEEYRNTLDPALEPGSPET